MSESESFEIDFDRPRRLGFPEAIYGAGKTLNDLRDILERFQAKGQNALATKVQREKGAALVSHFSGSFFDERSGIFMLQQPQALPENETSKVAILSAGTSDAAVVDEAYYTLNYLGHAARRVHDIGIAGIHRLLNKLDSLRQHEVLIVVAGFEGALPTAVGGLLPQPIIAVPASVGYGVSAGGNVALQTMLSSCANGLTVVNIDNGYGAALAAHRIIA